MNDGNDHGPAREADIVLRGGRVWPGRGLPPATALAAAGGRLLAVGGDALAGAFIGPRTRVVELRGRRVVPGFNDAHVHLLAGGSALLSVDLRDAHDEAELAGRLAAHVRSLPAGTWVLQGNWDHEAWPSRALPTRQAIDLATPEHPVFVTRLDSHMALANSLALRTAGVTAGTPDPDGGTIVRDSAGQPTGVLKDNAMVLVTRAMPPASRETNLRAARAALRHAAELGVTSIHDNSSADALATFQELHARGELTARLNVWRYVQMAAALRGAGVRSGLGDEWLRVGAVKILADGSMGAGTAAFFAPYADDPTTSGLLLFPADELNRLVRELDADGFQLAVHAIGDRANSLVLDAFEAALQTNGAGHDRRLRIEHAQVVRAEDLARYARLGVVASVQPSHAIDDMRWLERRIGPDRARDAYRWRSFLSAGVTLAFGTDWPVEPLDPRLGLYAAVMREYPQGGPQGGWFPEERIGLEEALHAYTRGSAYAERTEHAKGTLEVGKLADLVVFADDVLAVAPRELLSTPVDLTVVGGRVVFERAGS